MKKKLRPSFIRGYYPILFNLLWLCTFIMGMQEGLASQTTAQRQGDFSTTMAKTKG